MHGRVTGWFKGSRAGIAAWSSGKGSRGLAVISGRLGAGTREEGGGTNKRAIPVSEGGGAGRWAGVTEGGASAAWALG